MSTILMKYFGTDSIKITNEDQPPSSSLNVGVGEVRALKLIRQEGVWGSSSENWCRVSRWLVSCRNFTATSIIRLRVLGGGGRELWRRRSSRSRSRRWSRGGDDIIVACIEPVWNNHRCRRRGGVRVGGEVEPILWIVFIKVLFECHGSVVRVLLIVFLRGVAVQWCSNG